MDGNAIPAKSRGQQRSAMLSRLALQECRPQHIPKKTETSRALSESAQLNSFDLASHCSSGFAHKVHHRTIALGHHTCCHMESGMAL